jgi:hypothetical protein
MNTGFENSTNFSFCNPQFIISLKTCPDFWRHAEKSAKPQCGIGGDCAFSVYNLAYAARRDVYFPCKLVDAEIERFYEICKLVPIDRKVICLPS